MSWIDDSQAGSPVLGGFLRAAGAVGLAGCVLLPASVILGDLLVPNHDFVSETISDLAAGRWEFIADAGLYSFALSLLACAVGGAHDHPGGARWSWGVGGLSLLALVVCMVAARNEYGDGDDGGVVIHVYLVYALGLLFALVPWLLSRGAGRLGRGYRIGLRWGAVLWALAAPVFFFVPTSIDGLYERGLGLIAVGIVSILSWFLWQRGRWLA